MSKNKALSAYVLACIVVLSLLVFFGGHVLAVVKALLLFVRDVFLSF